MWFCYLQNNNDNWWSSSSMQKGKGWSMSCLERIAWSSLTVATCVIFLLTAQLSKKEAGEATLAAQKTASEGMSNQNLCLEGPARLLRAGYIKLLLETQHMKCWTHVLAYNTLLQPYAEYIHPLLLLFTMWWLNSFFIMLHTAAKFHSNNYWLSKVCWRLRFNSSVTCKSDCRRHILLPFYFNSCLHCCTANRWR